jgi:hypothetical protein
MRRIPWDVLLALLVGLAAGLAYAWTIAPRAITDAGPNALRADFKDQYRSAIAAAYAATGDLPRAHARLALLEDPDPIDALNAQAQRMLAGSGAGEGFEGADEVAALALALGEDGNDESFLTPTAETIGQADSEQTSTASFPSATPEISTEPTEAPEFTETPETIQTELAGTGIVSTPRPTLTPTPEPGEPFALTGQETVCDPNLPDGLLQVVALNASRRQTPGIEIVITWDGGKEQFFTGLKPELGNGYADYIMTPDTTYTVQLARGSDVALGITAPTCQTADGDPFSGSIKLTFQQP